MKTLEQKVQRLIDIEDIKQLKLRYALSCDNNYDPEGIVSCFTEDAVWDAGELGHCRGREEILEFFAGVPDIAKFAVHYTTNPIIEVNGDLANGSWYLWQPMMMTEGNQAVWLMAHYEEQYLRTDGRWLIKSLKLITKSLTNHDTSFC